MFFCFSKIFFIQALILLLAFCPSLITTANPTNASQQLHQRLRDNQPSDSDLTSFPRDGVFDLVLDDPDSLEFEICCDVEPCKARVSFCFPTSDQKQQTLYGCGADTCAYNLELAENGKYYLNGVAFSSTGKCFTGKLDQTLVYAIDFENEDKPQPSIGCPMKVDDGSRFKLNILSTAQDVTVKALNAKKYIPPTTPAPQLDHSTDESVAEGGISGGVLALIIVGGVLIVLLIIISIGTVVYCCYYKPKNAKKSLPAVTVIKVNGPKRAVEVQPEMPSSQQQAQPKVKSPKDAEKEVKPKVEPSKPKLKIAKAPKNVEANPPKAAKNSPLKTALEDLHGKTAPTQESSKSDGAPPPVIDENDYDENAVVAPPPSTAPQPPPLAVPPPAPTRPARRSHPPMKKPQSKKKPSPSGKYYDNGRPYVQTPCKSFIRSGGWKKDSLDGTSV